MVNTLLRALPRVDELCAETRALCPETSEMAVTAAVRETISALRDALLAGETATLPDRATLAREAAERAKRASTPSLRPVLNATGVVLHTNLGRACMSERAARAAYRAASGYTTLEYDPATGARGSRNAHVESLLCDLTGAESALVVNNNAAAVLLLLSALTAGGEVIVSRGELVEIGGSFRVPDIMAACGAALREVGTTNRTSASDYAAAIGARTRALLKVHTSNYRVVGFTESVSRDALVSLGREHGVPVFEDLGSGTLFDLEALGLHGEPLLADAVRAGVDVATCSGDKLLGGPQAGLLVGKRRYLDLLRRHPLYRALRPDKMTLAALEETLRAYAEHRAETELPTLEMLAATPETLRTRARQLVTALEARGLHAEVISTEDAVGGGSVPTQTLAGFAAALSPEHGAAQSIEARLRSHEPPVIARIAQGRVLLCVRTLRDEELETAAEAVAEAVR